MTTAFDAVLFDMDGTLLDSMPFWRRINIDFLAARNLTPPDEIRADILSTSNRVAAQLYAERFDLEMTVAEIMAEYRARMAVYYATEIQPKPHALDYIETLVRHGVKVAIATATPAALAIPALERHGLMKHMRFLLSGFDTGISKEDPAYYHLGAQKIGADPGRCVMFEDALYAMRAAREAGLVVYGIEDVTQKQFEAESRAVCDRFVSGFPELILEMDA